MKICYELRLIAAIFALLLMNCAVLLAQHTPPQELNQPFSFDDKKYETMVVAKIGGRPITAQEFLLSYAFGPAFPKREPDSKRRYLNFMMYEKLLALDGLAHHTDTTAIARRTLAELEGDLATEELYKDDVRSKVKVTQKEIHDGIRGESKHLTVRWLYAATLAESQQQVVDLKHGVPFDSLYARHLSDSVKNDDRSMATTSFRLHIKNPLLANVIDTLHVRSYSLPVHVADGFYILETASAWTDPVATETEMAKLQSDVQRALMQMKSDSLSDLYIKNLMTGQHPTIERKAFDILHVVMAKQILSPSKFAEWKLGDRLRERWGITGEVGIQDHENDTLVQLTSRVFAVSEFLDWYHAREYNLKLNESSPEAFFLSLESEVWQMVRDRLLTARAFARGLQRRETVRKQREWWRDKIAYRLAKDAIMDSIPVNDSLLLAYYKEHLRDYRNAKGDTMAFDTSKDDVKKNYYTDKTTERLLHRMVALKKRYPIRVFDANLKSLNVENENDPKAIDVYIAKTGGIFPRQAFPTIDFEWQTWN